MVLATRRRTRIALALLALLLAVGLWEAKRFREMVQWNQQIASGNLENVSLSAPPEVRFALAYASVAKADDQTALNRYRELQTNASLAQPARYNSANVLMRQAMALQVSATPGQATPLLVLAKENYREVLRAEAEHWDARHDLGRAQRLLPDPEDSEPVTSETPRDAERAATTMRGFSPGLP
jgi:mxaK protein